MSRLLFIMLLSLLFIFSCKPKFEEATIDTLWNPEFAIPIGDTLISVPVTVPVGRSIDEIKSTGFIERNVEFEFNPSDMIDENGEIKRIVFRLNTYNKNDITFDTQVYLLNEERGVIDSLFQESFSIAPSNNGNEKHSSTEVELNNERQETLNSVRYASLNVLIDPNELISVSGLETVDLRIQLAARIELEIKID